jgi:predicted 3-demethylubiquinone-9 3-methyltransferase (glyoxalase superfamily)
MKRPVKTCVDQPIRERPPSSKRKPVEVSEAFHVLVLCRDEAEQRAVFEKLSSEGRQCRLLTV